jgi:hypothetical protein
MFACSRNEADSAFARVSSSSSVSSGATSTCSSLTTGFSGVHAGTSTERMPPARRASSFARSWISASL